MSSQENRRNGRKKRTILAIGVWEDVMIARRTQDARTEGKQLIAEAQAARVRVHVRAMLLRLGARRARLPQAA